jgi:hypothetical protein
MAYCCLLCSIQRREEHPHSMWSLWRCTDKVLSPEVAAASGFRRRSSDRRRCLCTPPPGRPTALHTAAGVRYFRTSPNFSFTVWFFGSPYIFPILFPFEIWILIRPASFDQHHQKSLYSCRQPLLLIHICAQQISANQSKYLLLIHLADIPQFERI